MRAGIMPGDGATGSFHRAALRTPTRTAAIGAALAVGLVATAALAQEAAPAGVGQADAATRVLIAGAHVAPDGALVPGGSVIRLAGDRIAQVRSGGDAVDTSDGASGADGVEVDRFPPGAVICAGLIDPHAALAVRGGRAELGRSVQPEIAAADALNAWSYPLAAALRGGVTMFALAPDDQNLIGGRLAVCRTGGPAETRIVLTDGPFKVSLSPDAFRVDREPTSRLGAVGLLRDTLSARPSAAGEHPLADLLSGRATMFAVTPAAADVLTLTELTAGHDIRLVLLHQEEARDAAEFARGAAGVIVGPLEPSGPRIASAAAVFEHAGVPVALTAGLPDAAPDALRAAAATAVRYGMSVAAARRAITTTPAELLGIADRFGSLQAGRAADIVVFSGDPLDLRSRVLAVYIAGQRVDGVGDEVRTTSW